MKEWVCAWATSWDSFHDSKYNIPFSVETQNMLRWILAKLDQGFLISDYPFSSAAQQQFVLLCLVAARQWYESTLLGHLVTYFRWIMRNTFKKAPWRHGPSRLTQTSAWKPRRLSALSSPQWHEAWRSRHVTLPTLSVCILLSRRRRGRTRGIIDKNMQAWNESERRLHFWSRVCQAKS